MPPVSRSTEDTAALALMVILNWLMAHLVTNWVMPPEVQSAAQTLLTMAIASWLNRQSQAKVDWSKIKELGVPTPPPQPKPQEPPHEP